MSSPWIAVGRGTRLAAAFGLGLVLSLAGPASAQTGADAPDQAPIVPMPNAPASFADLTEQLVDAVVNVSTSQDVAPSEGLEIPDLPEGSPFQEFFDEFFNNQQGGNRPRRVNSLGSGFVIDEQGIIVTNNHVIAEADEIVVNFNDGRELPAEVIGVDQQTDLAVLRVQPATPLKAVDFGDSDGLRVGDWVVAIGNPFGLGGTVTAGIVSARNRDINQGSFDDFIQTDAAINRGNSGGPLFNLRGEVIGINTAIFSPGSSGGSVGVGFSVPANLARTVISQIKEYGTTRRGTMGLKVLSVDQAIAEAYGLRRPEGAIITQVEEDGPAEAAGLEVGDLITQFNNQPVKESRDLSRIISVSSVGAKMSVRYVRKGKSGTATVTLAPSSNAPADDAEGAAQAAMEELSNILGVQFRAIEDTDRRRRNIPRSVQGVVVDRIDNGSDALGKLRIGSVVTEVNFQPVSSPEQAIEAAEEAARQDKPVLLQIWGSGEVSFISVRTK